MENFESVINEKGFLVYTIVGVSMMPLLRERKDSVHLVKITRPLKKKDVVLFKRDNGQYVLHRIIKIKDNSFIIIGDNQYTKELVRPDQILAVMEGYYKIEKYHSINSFGYKFYKTFTVPFLRPFRYLKAFLYKVYRHLFKRKK